FRPLFPGIPNPETARPRASRARSQDQSRRSHHGNNYRSLPGYAGSFRQPQGAEGHHSTLRPAGTAGPHQIAGHLLKFKAGSFAEKSANSSLMLLQNLAALREMVVGIGIEVVVLQTTDRAVHFQDGQRRAPAVRAATHP